MSDPLTYSPRQTVSQVWVFQLGVDLSEMAAWTPPDPAKPNGAMQAWPLPDALGLAHLDPAKVEVFRAETLSDYGLARYLTEANGFSEQSVAPMAATLDALTGPLVLVFSGALGGSALTLTPRAPLQFVGMFETRPDTTRRPPVASDAARGQLAPELTNTQQPARLPLWPLALFIALAIGLIAVLLFPKL